MANTKAPAKKLTAPKAKPAKDEKPAQETDAKTVTSGPLSASDMAEAVGTDPRTLRKFLRDASTPYEPCGQGKRYTFAKKDVARLKKLFDQWSKGSAAKKADAKAAKAKAKAKDVVVEDLSDEIEEIDLELETDDDETPAETVDA